MLFGQVRRGFRGGFKVVRDSVKKMLTFLISGRENVPKEGKQPIKDGWIENVSTRVLR